MIKIDTPTLVSWLFVFLWSTGFIAAKYGLPYAPPFTFLFIRMVIVVVVFCFLVGLFKSKPLNLSQALHQMVVGVLLHVGYLGSVFAAINLNMPAGIVAIIVGLQPILTAILALLFFKEILTRYQWVGLFVGLFGVVMVLDNGIGEVSLINNRAFMFAILALISICAATLYQKKFGDKTDLIYGSLYQYIITVIVLFFIAYNFESFTISFSITLILAILWLVFGLSLAAILLLMYMIRKGEAAKVASYFYLIPILVSLEAFLLFDEKLSTTTLIGMFITLCGVVLVLKKKKMA